MFFLFFSFFLYAVFTFFNKPVDFSNNRRDQFSKTPAIRSNKKHPVVISSRGIKITLNALAELFFPILILQFISG